MSIKIKYCSSWNFEPKAASLAKAIKDATGEKAELVAGSGGVFEVTQDGEMLFSKREQGRFPEPNEVIEKLK